MAMLCAKCGLVGPDSANVCEACGSATLRRQVPDAPDRLQRWSGFALIMLFILVIVVLFVRSAHDFGDQRAAPVASAPKVLSPAEHLSTAKTLYASGTIVGEMISAQDHLNAISQDATEYQEAKLLARKVEARRGQLEKQEEIERNPIRVVKSTWQAGGFGAVGIWTVTFENLSNKPVGNIKYRTAYFAETGRQVDKGGIDSVLSDGLIQKVVPPKSRRTIEINDGFIHHESARARFEMVGWEFIR